MNVSKTKKLTMIGMLCALAYVAVVVGRVPVVLFLKYDPKDIVIVIGGLIYGPFVSLAVTLVVSTVQMITISGTGILGCIMNIISSCSFACTAAWVYKKTRRLSGAMLGLFGGWACQVVVMMFWNWLIAPIYMGYPREAVVKLLLPAFLPFNLIKGGLNAAMTMLLYKPIVTALRRSNLIPAGRPCPSGKEPARDPVHDPGNVRIRKGVLAMAVCLLAACVLWMLLLHAEPV